jgi:hypothetical protein
MDKNTFLSVVATFYYKSDVEFQHGLHEELFEEIVTLLGINEIPSSVRTWMNDNKLAKNFYKVPEIVINVDEIVNKMLEDNVVHDNILSQLKNCNNGKNHKVFFNDGTSRKVDVRSAGIAIRALRSERIKPDTRMQFQEYCKESFGNLMKFVKQAKLMGL